MASLNFYPTLPSRRNIRLIRLHGSARLDDVIYFDLISCPLDTTPPPFYEALSYTWSGQTPERVVYSNRQKFWVTKNAEAAMRRLRPRKLGARRYLWIDTICINQRDNREKSSQVEMMGEIFAKAQRVNIWLGDGNESSIFILRWLRVISYPFLPLWFLLQRFSVVDDWAAEYNRRGWPRRLYRHLLIRPFIWFLVCALFLVGIVLLLPFQALPVLKDLKRRLRAGMADMTSREYWERVWTVQEAALSRSCFVFCGPSTPLHIQSFVVGHILFAFLCDFSISHIYYTYLLHMRPYGLEFEEGLESLCAKKASLPVDKIYAVKTMFLENLRTLPVDYSRPPRDVYTDTAHCLIETSRSVKFLRYACQGDRNDGFPTWVPAWNSAASTAQELCKFAPAMVSQQPMVHTNANKWVLELKALRVDVATAGISDQFPISPPLDDQWIDLAELVAAGNAFTVFQAWIEASSDVKEMDWKLDQSALLLAGMSNLNRGKVLTRLKGIWPEREYGIEWSRNLLQALPEDPFEHAFNLKFLKLVTGRFLFWTQGQRVGLSLLPVCERDQVVMFTGEQLPYLIRRCPGKPGHYTLVSPCWISGYTNGEEWLSWTGAGLLQELEWIQLV